MKPVKGHKPEKSEKLEKAEREEKAAPATSPAKKGQSKEDAVKAATKVVPPEPEKLVARDEKPGKAEKHVDPAVAPAKAEAKPQGPIVLADAVTSLMDGNERFAQGFTRARDLISMREHPARPLAVVLTCADATVPPELVFDQPLGSLIVVRTAAHLVDEGALAAVEDAVSRLEVPVVVVMGHHDCHAVAASAKNAAVGAGEATVAAKLKPLLAPLRKVFTGEDLSRHAVETNVGYASMQLAKRSKLLRGGKAAVMRVVYDERTGKAQWLDAETKEEEPRASERLGRSAH